MRRAYVYLATKPQLQLPSRVRLESTELRICSSVLLLRWDHLSQQSQRIG